MHCNLLNQGIIIKLKALIKNQHQAIEDYHNRNYQTHQQNFNQTNSDQLQNANFMNHNANFNRKNELFYSN